MTVAALAQEDPSRECVQCDVQIGMAGTIDGGKSVVHRGADMLVVHCETRGVDAHAAVGGQAVQV